MRTIQEIVEPYARQFTATLNCPACTLDYGNCRVHTPLSQVADELVEAMGQTGALTSNRTAHMRGVGRRAAHLSGLLRDGVAPITLDMWVATAAVHDVGYALPETGVHCVDGARLLRRAGFPDTVVSQVAWHSTGWWEATARGLNVDRLVSEFGDAPLGTAWHDLVWVADFTTSPTGSPMTIESRLADIRARYQHDSPQVTALVAAASALATAQSRFEHHLRERPAA